MKPKRYWACPKYSPDIKPNKSALWRHADCVPVLVVPLDEKSVEDLRSKASKLVVGRHGGCWSEHAAGIRAAFDAIGITRHK